MTVNFSPVLLAVPALFSDTPLGIAGILNSENVVFFFKNPTIP